MSIAELWIEFFEHYSLGIMSADNVISIRSTANLSKEDRQWKGKKMAIEDPFSTKRSLTRLVKTRINKTENAIFTPTLPAQQIRMHC